MHGGAYKNPLELPEGAVLVVGSGQSGDALAYCDALAFSLVLVWVVYWSWCLVFSGVL